MSYTNRVEVTSAWQNVADAGPNAFVQLVTDGPIYAHVGQSQPSASSTVGAVLANGELNELIVEGMEEGDAVYVRCRDGETEAVIVLAPGSPPA